MNALEEAIQKVGGVPKAAAACGISRNAMYKHKRKGALPRTEYTGETSYAKDLAAASNGAFTKEWLLENAKPATQTKTPAVT